MHAHDICILELINSYIVVRCVAHACGDADFLSNPPPCESKTPVTSRHHLPSLSVRVRVPAFLESHNWISPGKSEPGVRYQWYTTNAPSRFPVCFHPFPLVRTVVSTQEPIFHRHCLVGYTTFRETFLFPPRSSIFPPTFLLSHPPSPNYCFLFCRSRHHRVATSRLHLSIFLSLSFCAPRYSHAILLATPTFRSSLR